jgi:hypothetical protein
MWLRLACSVTGVLVCLAAFVPLATAAPETQPAATTQLVATTKPTTAPKSKEEKPVPPTGPEDEYYQIVQLAIPQDLVLEVSGLEVMPDGRPIIGTRRGDIYIVDNAYAQPAPATVPAAGISKKATKPSVNDEHPLINNQAKFTRWATGLHEIMGLAQRDGWVYASQRGEITRLKDASHCGHADTYETFYDGWGISGDQHEYPMMSRFDRAGNLYVALCLTGSVFSDAPFRGWMFKVTPDGRGIPWACGIRSPGAVGFDDKGNVFYTDNQGFWNGTDGLKFVTAGSFQGNPSGNKWYAEALKLNPGFGPKPPEPNTPSRIYIEAAKFPALVPPAVLLPYKKVGQSSSGIVCDTSGGKFGPFAGQLFVADQAQSNVARCGIENVRGVYQGWCVPFRRGFASGIVPIVQAPDGSWIVGGTNRGWGSTGSKPFALERLVWTGKTPFEMLDMHATADGFELRFTEPVDRKTASDPASYELGTYTYIYQKDYGSPEVEGTTPAIKSIRVSEDGRRVRLVIDGLRIGHVHELHLDGVHNAAGRQLLQPVAYYTLWNIPDPK